MSEARGIREIAYFDCAGGGQVMVDGGFAYVGHIDAPHGTTIIDVRDPKHPKKVAELTMPPGTHSHKVRVAKGLMIVNHEITDERLAGEYRGGLGIYDVGTPYRPREVARWETRGKGVHRFDFDGDYVYGSPTVDGYLGNIVMILDVREPSRPQEVGRWWMPGQWIAGGETPTWRGTMHRCHHPAAGRPALHELLARWFRDSRHRRYGAPALRLRARLESAVSVPDAQRGPGPFRDPRKTDARRLR